MYNWCQFCKYFKESNNGTSRCTKVNRLVGKHDWCKEFEWILEEYNKNEE